MISKLAKALESASIERQVEDAYNEVLKKAFPDAMIEYPFACDGYCEFNAGGNKHRLLIEYKYDEDMSSKVVRSKVLVQVLAYMKKFEENGKPLPSVILVADKNECFVLHANDLVKWLDFEGAKWDGAPSGMASANPDLVLALAEDDTRNAFVFDVNNTFDFDVVVQKIKDMATNTVRKVRITEHNVDKVFKLFSEKIILGKKVSPNDMVALFFAVVTGSEDVYLHPTKKNCIVYNSKNLKCDSSKFKAFCSHFSTTCSPKEKARLAAISDRLIEDTKRRRQGAFFTPTPFVDYAHGMVTKQLGEDWKEKHVVWDCCCGTKNLTRDYKFKELYCSTLEQAELDISKNYNRESIAFQFDFLNDELKRVSEGGKVPDSLIDALEQDKPVIFVLNPPYGSMCGLHTDEKNYNIEQTATYNKMKEAGLGGSSTSNLYTQFLFVIVSIKQKYNLSNCNIAVFCPPSFANGQRYRSFREKFYGEFEYIDAIQFDSAHFSDVAFGAIMFSIWKNGKTTFNLLTHIVDDTDEGIKWLYDKEMASSDGKIGCNIWMREKEQHPIDAPTLKTGITVHEAKVMSDAQALGYMWANGNNIFQAPQRTMLYSSASYYGHGTNIFASNFDKCITTFAARLACNKDAYNQFDEFIAPNTAHQNWPMFVNDSLVYCLFNSKSQQSSLRKVTYHGKLWDIKNEFFWIPAKQMAEWADAAGLDETYAEANASSDRFVCQKLQSLELSDEAKVVLSKATELVQKSMKYRKLFDDEHSEYQVQNWDAGWYQVKAVLKEYMPNELKEFKELYAKLTDKIRPMVYELGFLRK